MYRTSIPTRYAFKFFYIGLITLILFLLLLAYVLSHGAIPLISDYAAIIADLTFAFIVLYASVEALNFTDRRKFVDYRYYFDRRGLYREKAMIMEWQDISDVTVTLETLIDRIPAKKDVAWAPSFNMMRDFSTPELTTRKKIARVRVSPVRGKNLSEVVIYTTTFRPLLMFLYRKLAAKAEEGNRSINIGFHRILPEPEKENNSATKE